VQGETFGAAGRDGANDAITPIGGLDRAASAEPTGFRGRNGGQARADLPAPTWQVQAASMVRIVHGQR
jgi:hypothetical protein